MSKSPMKMQTKNPSKILGEKSNSSNSFTTRINNFIFLKEIKMKPPPLSFSPQNLHPPV